MFAKYFQTFIIAWPIVLIANQVFLFGGAFAPYCLIAAAPHTALIAAAISYFYNKTDSEEAQKNKKRIVRQSPSNNRIDANYTIYDKTEKDTASADQSDFEEISEPFCPKCGSKMILRTARKGKYTGQNFWGCSKFPSCKSIINI
jgi:hypothetical protein